MQSVMLRAKGLHTFQNNLSEIPQGSLLQADNVIINRDGIVESRRGIAIYGNTLGSTTDRASQLLKYKNRILRHFNSTLEFDSDGLGTFLPFNGTFNEVVSGLRIKGIEVSGNLLFTTDKGIEKISAVTTNDFTTASGFIRPAGGAKALDIRASANTATPGFLSAFSAVAYRVVWGYKDVNQNLILGTPSNRVIVSTNAAGTFTASLVPSQSGTITAISAANPTTITTSAPHGLTTGQQIKITGSNSTPNIDTTWTVSVTGAFTFTIPVSVSIAGTAGSFVSTDGTTTLITTSSPHGLSTGGLLYLQGGISSVLNGTFVVTSTGTNTLTIPTVISTAEVGNFATQTAVVDLNFLIPSSVTSAYFYQVYRSAMVPNTDIPDDELNLVIEDNPTVAQLAAGSVSVTDSTPEAFRVGGPLLYTNPISGEGIAQANEPPPLAQDLALFKNTTFYANTKTRHSSTINLLSVIGISPAHSGAITAISAANPTHITSAGHGLSNGMQVIIAQSNSTPSIDGVWTVAVLDANTFTIPVNVTIAGTTGNFSTTENRLVINDGTTFSVYYFTNIEDVATHQIKVSTSPSVAVAVDETAKSLTYIINSNMSDIVSAFYLSGANDIPGQFLLQRKDLSDIAFYLSTTNSTLAHKFSPSLGIDVAITAIGLGSTPLITATSHGFSTGDTVILRGTNSTPSIDGVYTVTVLDANTFTVAVNSPVTVVGTTGTAFSGVAASDNEKAPNRVYFSKFQQPEAVPLVNFIDIGPRDQPILRILALRDSLFVLKSDGIFNLTGDNATNFNVTLFDSSTQLFAPDSAAVLNNQIYGLTSQGIATVSSTGVSIISRPIEDKILKLIASQYLKSKQATWAVGYESDRAYLIFAVTNPEDTIATQAFRYNTFTDSWTRYPISKTCGVVNASGDDKFYLGAGDTNSIEKERKNFTRKDYADRQFNETFPINAVNGDIITPSSTAQFDMGDALVQTQYLTISKFNSLLRKLDLDSNLNDPTFFSTLAMSPGNNLSSAFIALATKLTTDDASRFTKTLAPTDINTTTGVISYVAHGMSNDTIIHFTSTGTLPVGISINTPYYVVNAAANTFQISATQAGSVLIPSTQGTGVHTFRNNYNFSGSADFATMQTEFNIIIDQLNASTGVFFINYTHSVGTVDYEVVALAVNDVTGQVTVNYPPPFIEGPYILYKGIACTAEYAPQSMNDPSMLKHVREATVIFENNAFIAAQILYSTDLSKTFEPIEFIGMGIGAWGLFPWGSIIWGGEGNQVPLRTLIPQQKQRCRFLFCQFKHINAFEQFALYGISFTYEMTSSRGYR